MPAAAPPPLATRMRPVRPQPATRPQPASTSPARVTVVFAHPDDETIGLGATLPYLPSVELVCVTDGAPRDGADARRAGCRDCAEYAALRHGELCRVLTTCGHQATQLHSFGLPDKEASASLVELARALAALFAERPPATVVTHPYEGGHPDHDATAFAVHAACRLLRASSRTAPRVLEMTSYHRGRGEIEWSTFLPGPMPIYTRPLDRRAQLLKRRLLDCHASQQAMLRLVPLDAERFRPAPAYDFTAPPHPGELLYEHFGWGPDGATWRASARAAFTALGLPARVSPLP